MRISPLEALGRWPRERPLACVWAEREGSEWSRWTVLAEPGECRVWEKVGTREGFAAAVRGLGRGRDESAGGVPNLGGWIGYVGYGVGAELEPAAGAGGRHGGWPAMAWLRCDRGLAFDHLEGRWWAFGGDEGEAGLNAREGAEGREECSLGSLRSAMGRLAFGEAAARAIELIHAGDVFQVNLSHRLSGKFRGSTRGLFGALAAGGPRHGAYLELPGGVGREPRALVSASPELFLSFDSASREVTTRPMKGTRAAEAGAGALEKSAKDRAELAMIVDLMRNDLGRVCEFGSIRVGEARVIERHGAGGLLQGVATVGGRLRVGLDVADLLCATFPAGSVTGAPKVRAMQIIGELEPVERGPYCGAIGMIRDSGDAVLSVAIRTALVSGGRLDYSVGAGIVAESEPGAEWAETMEKAGVVMRLVGAGGRAAEAES